MSVSLIGALVACTQALLAPSWSVNPSRTMLWGGAPYIPVGVRIPGSPDAILRAHDAGLRDVIVEMPADGSSWVDTIKLLEANEMRYFVAISNKAANANVIAVEPEGYRIPGITGERILNLRIAGASRALMAVITQRDAAIQELRPVTLQSGSLRERVDTRSTLEHVVLLYPELENQGMLDYWEGWDRHRDQLLRTIQANPTPPGLRGLVNPIGSVTEFPGPDTRLIPTSRMFRLEFEAYLRAKYTSVLTASRAWALRAVDIDQFQDLARLVPLWTDARGVPKMWDAGTDKIYDADYKRSTFWRDFRAALSDTATNRYERLVQSIQSVWNVPVVQEWTGWNAPYASSTTAVSGLGFVGDAQSRTELIDGAAEVVSVATSRGKAMLSIATDLSDTTDVNRIVNDLKNLGVRGFYFRSSDPEAMKTIAAAQTALNADRSLSQWSIAPVYFPAACQNPATSGLLAGGRYWVPALGEGERVDYGPNFGCYRYVGYGRSYYALWRTDQMKRTKIRMADAKTATFVSSDGNDVGAKAFKGGIEITLGSSPVLISGLNEPPAPEEVLGETTNAMGAFFATAGNSIPDADQEALLLKDLLRDYETRPGAALVEMRRMLRRVQVSMSKYVWIEAESSRNHTFGDVFPLKGASRDNVLRLRTRIPSDVAPLRANFTFRPRQLGQHEFWLAARIPAGLRDRVSVQLGDLVFKLDAPPVSLYSGGFGWYKLGTANLADGEAEIAVFVDSDDGASMELDALMISPMTFRPDGITPPLILPQIPSR
ncbi:MAG: hypothetical protein JNM85_07775 [Chthonomonas sp.]|nr:hypothetical protein [Chthonomonas sp.]